MLFSTKMKASGANDSNAACESDTNVSTGTELEFTFFISTFPFFCFSSNKVCLSRRLINYTMQRNFFLTIECIQRERMATADLDDIDLNEGISVPSAPTGVEVADFEATSAKIKWKPAPKNETAFVNGYLIEYKDTGDEEWSEYLDKVKPNKYPTAEINDLTTGAKYEFRVSVEEIEQFLLKA